jgi:hypothetical protein
MFKTSDVCRAVGIAMPQLLSWLDRRVVSMGAYFAYGFVTLPTGAAPRSRPLDVR